ncbi:MAG: hypothetical protein ACI8RZ_004937 [Myxococcota bacterium]|jgi:hypothetical protein
MMLLITLATLAHAMDLTLTLAPAPGGVLSQTLQCTVPDVKKGELLALSAQTLGASQVVPMVEIGSVGTWGVVWLSALQVKSSGGTDYPGLVSMARPTRASTPQRPCAIGETCVHTFDRTEQSMTLSIAAAGSAPGSAEPAELVWRTTSWYREAREVVCSPLAN